MHDIISVLFPCITPRDRGSIRLPTTSTTSHLNLSPSNNPGPSPLLYTDDEKLPLLTHHEAAAHIVDVLFTATNTGTSGSHHPAPLAHRINAIAHQAGGWSDYLADATRKALEAALTSGREMSDVLAAAYDKACEAAEVFEQFSREHPLATAVFVTVIAVGVLVLLAPWVVEILGFGELGVVEGSWAAFWQAAYRGVVPKGSLFSYLQRLGMTWK